MPIRPENRDRYPADWQQIRMRILARAGNRCEGCGVRNGALGGRTTHDGSFLEALPTGDNGLRLTWPRPGDYGWCGPNWHCRKLRIIRIVLTIAHLDHTPENCAADNLRAWCQRCHNRYDAKMRLAGIRRRARSASAVGDLFEGAA